MINETPPIIEHLLCLRWRPGPDTNEPGEKWEVRERRHPADDTTWAWTAGTHDGEEGSRELARKSVVEDEDALIAASFAVAEDAAETAREIARDMREIDDGPL
jgi:hypothetical protein